MAKQQNLFKFSTFVHEIRENVGTGHIDIVNPSHVQRDHICRLKQRFYSRGQIIRIAKKQDTFELQDGAV